MTDAPGSRSSRRYAVANPTMPPPTTTIRLSHFAIIRSRVKLIYSVSAVVLLLAVLALGIYGMGRSLWLDEAWVANSIQAPSLAAMFYYPGWLQINPPLFLLLARASVRVLGASNVAFRVVPLLLALAAAAGMLAVSRRLLRPSLALLATAVVVFDPTAIEYSRTLKPYSGELAATAILLLAAVRYLQQPDRPRYLWLLAAVAVAMPLAYSAVFLDSRHRVCDMAQRPDSTTPRPARGECPKMAGHRPAPPQARSLTVQSGLAGGRAEPRP